MTTVLEWFLTLLPDAKKSGSGWSACCPAHDDRQPSLSIAEGDDGRVLLKCHAGCPVDAICAALGLKPTDLFVASTSTVLRPAREKHQYRGHANGKSMGNSFATADETIHELERRHGPSTAQWTYRDGSGVVVGVVIRWDLPEGGKEIRPVSRYGAHWRIAGMPTPRPLYRLEDLRDAKRVYVCEGEKSVEAARSLGLIATTSAHGSKSPDKTDWSPMAGKEVVLLPDNDPAGLAYADAVVGLLDRLKPAPTIKVVELPDLPEKGDIIEWIESHGDAAEPESMRDELEQLADGADSVQRNDPAKSGTRVVSFKPFPTEVLPEPIRSFVLVAARAICCDASYIVLPLLAVLASAIGNTRRLTLKPGWNAPAIIWTAIVGESGTAKTPAFSLVMRPIKNRQAKALKQYEAELQQYVTDQANYDKAFTEWKRDKKTAEPAPDKPKEPQARRCMVGDTTIEALAPILKANWCGVLVARDELAGWIGSFDRYASGKGGADSAHWLSMFNGESISVDRKTGIPKTIFVPRASVCVTGGIQPAILHRALGTQHRESGLAARLLVCCPPRKAKKWTDAGIDPSMEEQLATLLDRLFELEPKFDEDDEPMPVLVRLSKGAHEEWKAYYDAHAQEQVDLTGDLSAAWSKLEEYAARLALVVHFVRWAADDPSLESEHVVDVDSVRAGVAMTQWFKQEVRRVYALLCETDEERDERRLVEWIDRKGGAVTAREVHMGCRWLREAGLAEAALNALAQSGQGTWEPSPRGARGQPTRRFRLTTASTVNGNRPVPDRKPNTVDVDEADAA